MAEKAVVEDAATADRVQQSEPATASAAQTVDPALPYDDPMRYAPAIVSNPKDAAPNLLSVNALRGTTGADFESEAAICRGAPEKNVFKKVLPFLFDERDFASYGEMKKYCLVKGDCCFVYNEDSDPKPLYAIPLDDFEATIEDRDCPDIMSITINPEPVTNKQRKQYVTVMLKYKTNRKQAPYQFTFCTENDATLAQRFADAVTKSVSNPARRGRSTASVVEAKDLGRGAAMNKAQPMI
jgi:hypothetical protein